MKFFGTPGRYDQNRFGLKPGRLATLRSFRKPCRQWSSELGFSRGEGNEHELSRNFETKNQYAASTETGFKNTFLRGKRLPLASSLDLFTEDKHTRQEFAI